MTTAHRRSFGFFLIAAAVLSGPAAAQSFVLHPQQYLISADAADARALWLQPAGLARRREATLAVFGGGLQHGPGGLRQYGAILANAGFAAGWQHERLGAGVKNDTWTVGFSAGQPRAGIGATRSWYRGTNTRDGSFTVGARYAPMVALDLSLMWRDIGSPVVLGDTVYATLLPAGALNLFGGRARLSAEWEIVTGDWGTSGVRAGASVRLVQGLTVTARGDFSGKLERRGFALAVSWNGVAGRATVFGTDIAGAPDPYGAYLSMVRPLDNQRRRPGLR